jgi:type IV pilus assembly protein PilA
MWLPGVLNLIYPWVMLIILSIIAGVANKSFTANPVVFGLLFLLILAAPSFLLPMYANAIYWRHVRNLIERLPRSVASVPEKRMARLERDGRTGVGALVAVLAVGLFFFIGIVGILAAIAIPAYQDYTIRSQVTEGLNLASAAKAGVAEYWAQNGTWPEHADIMESSPSGKYTTSVQVDGGSVVITYGGQANTHISGKRLALMPGIASEGHVVWICGNAEVPSGVEASGGPQGSEVANKYLPSSCRASP